MTDTQLHDNLAALIKRGGIYYHLEGKTPPEVLKATIAALSLPPGLDKNQLLQAVLDRESLMPTAIGEGLALPHPRTPLITAPEQQFIALGFLSQPVDWRSLDGKPVSTVLLICSASQKLHLHTLSRLNFLCRQAAFRDLLKNQAPQADLITAIEEAEKNWA